MAKQSRRSPPLLSSREVRVELGTAQRPLSPTTLWRWVKRGLIPQPHHLHTRAVWYADDIAVAKARLLQPPRAA